MANSVGRSQQVCTTFATDVNTVHEGDQTGTASETIWDWDSVRGIDQDGDGVRGRSAVHDT